MTEFEIKPEGDKTNNRCVLIYNYLELNKNLYARKKNIFSFKKT